MITVKGETNIDKFIIGHIIDPNVSNVEFKNITFDCKIIKDASGHIFVRKKAGEWISVNERLPNKEERVLVTDSSYIEFGKLIDGLFGDLWLIWADGCWDEATKVTAWMPLPDPYYEDGEEE